jgi:RNA recognition motif-containing protein
MNHNSMGGGAANNAGGGGGDDDGFILFAYNIGTDADERTLWQLFSPHGAVQKVNIIRDFQKDQCKGYGFVTMTHYQDAMTAIQALNGQPYNGRNLQVSFKSNNK